MGKLVVTEFVTLDGVAQSPGAPDEDAENGFRYGGWQVPFMGEESAARVFDQAKDMDALLMGRGTFEIFSNYWPTGPDESPFTAMMNQGSRYVASTTLSAPLPWDATLLEGDTAEAIRAVKDRHQHVHMFGSIGLFPTLVTNRLIDRLHLWFHPVALGSGKRAFGEGVAPSAFTLVDTATYPSGVVLLTYEAAGDPTFGTVD